MKNAKHQTNHPWWVNWVKPSQLAVSTLVLSVMVACGGGGGASGPEVQAISTGPSQIALAEVSSLGSSSIDVSWLPASNGAATETGVKYQVHASTDLSFVPSPLTLKSEGTDILSAHITGLNASTKYAVLLVATNSGNYSSMSSALTVTTSAFNSDNIPGVVVKVPADSQVATVSNDQVTLLSGVTAPTVGQFIASTQGDGFLREVTQVSTVAGQTVLQTKPASLNKVINNLELSSSFTLTSLPTNGVPTQAGVVVRPVAGKSNETEWQWSQTNFRLSGTPASRVNAQTPLQIGIAAPKSSPTTEKTTLLYKGDFNLSNDVSFSFDPEFRADVTIGFASLKSAEFEMTGRAEVAQKMAISASGAGNLDSIQTLIKPRKFTKYYLTPSGVPIVIAGEFSADLQIQGNVNGAINATEEIKFSLEDIVSGMAYVNGSWQTTENVRPSYQFKISGNGDAQAHLTLTLIPKMAIKFQGVATGRLTVPIYINADAGVHGQVLADIIPSGTTTDADYWLTKGQISGGVDAYVMADVSVLDYNLAKWPANAKFDDYTTFQKLPLVADTPIAGLPSLTASVDAAAMHPSSESAVLIKGRFINVANPFKDLFGGGDSLLPFASWTAPKVIGLNADFTVVPSPAGSDPGDVWLEFANAGTYKVRLGGYSSMGAWARQVAEVDVEVSNTTIVTSVTPTSMVLNQPATFTVAGSNLSNDTTFSLANCSGIATLPGGTRTSRQFSCTPTAVGTHNGTISSPKLVTPFGFNVVVATVVEPPFSFTVDNGASSYKRVTVYNGTMNSQTYHSLNIVIDVAGPVTTAIKAAATITDCGVWRADPTLYVNIIGGGTGCIRDPSSPPTTKIVVTKIAGCGGEGCFPYSVSFYRFYKDQYLGPSFGITVDPVVVLDPIYQPYDPLWNPEIPPSF